MTEDDETKPIERLLTPRPDLWHVRCTSGNEPPCAAAVEYEIPMSAPYVGFVREWFVSIPDLSALMQIVKDEGKCVVSQGPAGQCELEIYDDYRE